MKRQIEATGCAWLLASIAFISLCWGSAASAAPTPTFRATATGTVGNLTIAASMEVADADAGKNGSVYLLAKFSGGWYAHNGTSWALWRSGPVPAHSTGTLTNRSIEVARDANASSLAGMQVFLGYGLNETDMLANGKYDLVYTLAEPVTVARSSQQRVIAPNVSDADKAALASGNSAFAFDLYRRLQNDPALNGENIFFSPLSISVALAMTYAGANGPTASEMAGALRFALPSKQLHPAFGWLDLELMSRGQGALGKDGQPFRLSVSNSLWGDRLSKFETPFLDTLAQYYGAGINLVDFRAAPDPSRTRINDWVAEKTEQRIKDLIPQGSVTNATRLVLTNAIYFNAAWQSKFLKQGTVKAPFTRLDGAAITVDMMSQDARLRYTAGPDYQAVELPYDGGELGMLIILPAAGRFVLVDQAFDTAALNTVLGALGSQNLRLGVPKFRVEGGFSVKAAMQALGMQTAFTDRADFTGISGTEALLIQDIFHKSFADIDENGTEAAAATGVLVGTTSIPVTPTVFRVDRPFLFFILDKKTGTIVFLGRLLSPKSS